MTLKDLQLIVEYVANSTVESFVIEHAKWVKNGIVYVLKRNNGRCNPYHLRYVLNSITR